MCREEIISSDVPPSNHSLWLSSSLTPPSLYSQRPEFSCTLSALYLSPFRIYLAEPNSKLTLQLSSAYIYTQAAEQSVENRVKWWIDNLQINCFQFQLNSNHHHLILSFSDSRPGCIIESSGNFERPQSYGCLGQLNLKFLGGTQVVLNVLQVIPMYNQDWEPLL